MTTTKRLKATRMTVCDLCNEEIEDGTPDETGSITAGYIAHPVRTPKTKHAWFRWPPPSRVRKTVVGQRVARSEEFRPRVYDFHAECILRLIEEAIATRQSRVDRLGLTEIPDGA